MKHKRHGGAEPDDPYPYRTDNSTSIDYRIEPIEIQSVSTISLGLNQVVDRLNKTFGKIKRYTKQSFHLDLTSVNDQTYVTVDTTHSHTPVLLIAKTREIDLPVDLPLLYAYLQVVASNITSVYVDFVKTGRISSSTDVKDKLEGMTSELAKLVALERMKNTPPNHIHSPSPQQKTIESPESKHKAAYVKPSETPVNTTRRGYDQNVDVTQLMGVQNLTGICWLSCILTVCLHSDRMMRKIAPYLLEQKPDTTNKTDKNLNVLKNMLLHTMLQRKRSLTDKKFKFVNPVDILKKLNSFSEIDFKKLTQENNVSCGSDPFLELRPILNLIGLGVKKRNYDADSHFCSIYQPFVHSILTRVTKAARGKAKMVHTSNGKLPEQGTVEEQMKNFTVDQLSDIIAIRINQEHEKKDVGSMPAHFLPRSVDNVLYELDAVIMNIPKRGHVVSGITLYGQPVMHENQTSGTHEGTHEGCKYYKFDWVTEITEKNKYVVRGYDAHKFTNKTLDGRRCKFYSSNKPVDVIYVYVKVNTEKQDDDNVDPTGTLSLTDIEKRLPDDVKKNMISVAPYTESYK
jgi:hypothetical protein